MNEPVWVKLRAVLQIHSEGLAEFGGSPGVRDPGAIESALARPEHLFAYGKPDLYDLTAAYTADLCQNHGFVDGNKRAAFLAGYLFLRRNSVTIFAEQAEVVAAMLSLADHTIDEAGYANWLREHGGEGPEPRLSLGLETKTYAKRV